MLLCTPSSAVIICCCDDDESTLSDITQAFEDLKKETDKAKSSLSNRMGDYENNLFKKDKGKQLYSVKKMNATQMYRTSISIKEAFEAEAATALINAAKISSTLSGAEAREDVGDEALKFSIKE